MMVYSAKYYIGWKLSEASSALSGLGYYKEKVAVFENGVKSKEIFINLNLNL